MIDKIIEELEDLYIDIVTEGDSSLINSHNNAIDKVIEIVNKHQNDGWVDVNDRLPTIETTQFNNVQYLCAMESGFYQVLPYCDGWNCFRDYTGYVSKSNEVNSIVAWKEIKPYIRKGDN